MRLHYQILELKTRHDFHIARAAAPAARRNVWVRLTAEDGSAGWGEAAPNLYYAEDADTVTAALEQVRGLIESLQELTLAALPQVEARLLQAIPRAAAARAALSAALLDLLGRQAGATVYGLLGLAAQAPRSSFTIGIDTIEAMRVKIREAASYPILKVKVGTPADEAILAMLREERPDAIVRVDANTGWSRAEAIANLPMLEAFQIELIEQPVPPDDLEGLAAVRAASPIPIIADESCKVAADVAKLEGAVDGVNIKLAKCGSLLEAVRIAEAARARDMSVMIGCMIESTLGIAAAMQVASLTDYVDLDGAALLANDPFAGPCMLLDGALAFNRSAGLGVTLSTANDEKRKRRERP